MKSSNLTKRKKKMKVLKNKYFTRVTIVISADSRFPTIPGKWETISKGCIRAWYTLDEYADCLDLYEVIRDAKE